MPGRRGPSDQDEPPRPSREDWDDDGDEDDEGPLDMLLDPACWPDDADEPTVPEGLLDEEPPLLDLDGSPDEEEDDLPLQDDGPMDDDLEDLDAPDDTEIPVLPWSFEVRVDGSTVPAQVDPRRQQTVWLRTDGAGGERRVVLEVAGKTLTVTVLVQLADQAGLLLGRDVLSGRFLLRP